MLDAKIQYLLDNKAEYLLSISDVLNRKLEVYGQTDFRSITYIEMLYSLVEASFLGYNQRLEIYKRLIEMLRKAGVNLRIPEPTKVTSDYVELFAGADNPGLTPSEIVSNLTQFQGKPTDDLTIAYNATNQVLYFCYPDTFSSATIYDQNGFNVTNGWTQRVETLIVDGQSIAYKVYESNNLTTVSNYSIKFNI